MGYVHAGGTDAPLGVVRQDATATTALIVPFTNWRGDYEHGYFSGMPECTQLASTCLLVDWPAPKTRVYLDGMPKATGDWVGSLLQEQQDESGLLYQRNRYYDPMTGQFTKMDPIGLAGGLNLYGFAAGDPVNFSDPFGLCPPEDANLDCDSDDAVWAAAGASVGFWIGGGGGAVAGLSCTLGAPACSTGGSIAGAAAGSAAGATAGLGIKALVDGLVNMFSRQSDAVNRAEGLRKTTDKHLSKMRDDPNSRDVPGWKTEINAHLDEISRLTRRMGSRTGDLWREYVQRARDQLGDFLP